jgi:hypothetical protein
MPRQEGMIKSRFIGCQGRSVANWSPLRHPHTQAEGKEFLSQASRHLAGAPIASAGDTWLS